MLLTMHTHCVTVPTIYISTYICCIYVVVSTHRPSSESPFWKRQADAGAGTPLHRGTGRQRHQGRACVSADPRLTGGVAFNMTSVCSTCSRSGFQPFPTFTKKWFLVCCWYSTFNLIITTMILLCHNAGSESSGLKECSSITSLVG